MQIHANTVDTNRKNENKFNIQENDDVKQNSGVMADFKKDFEHNFEIAKKRNELIPNEEDLAQDQVQCYTEQD